MHAASQVIPTLEASGVKFIAVGLGSVTNAQVRSRSAALCRLRVHWACVTRARKPACPGCHGCCVLLCVSFNNN